MSNQILTEEYTSIQSTILDLENKYFNFLDSLISSQDFINNLRRVENNIQLNYPTLTQIWDLKNKLKIPAERLLRYHIYKLPNVCGFYPSPVSGDLAVEVTDAIINLDIKTIDVVGNSGDIQTIQFEHNQTSFRNTNVLATGNFRGFQIQSNLPSIDPATGKPILTYLLKIVYYDDGQAFHIFKRTGHPIITLTCLPNGELSHLFNNDLFSNAKNYNYYSKSDGTYYTHKHICQKSNYDHLNSNNEKYKLIEDICDIPSSWEKVTIVDKLGYYDPSTETLWVTVLKGSNGTEKRYELHAVKSPHTCRFNHSYLVQRYTSNGNPWNGIKNYFLSTSSK